MLPAMNTTAPRYSPATIKASSSAEDIASAFLSCADWPLSWNADRWANDLCLSLKFGDQSKALEVARILVRQVGGPTPASCLRAWVRGMGINPEALS